jgi:hypothetical protein
VNTQSTVERFNRICSLSSIAVTLLMTAAAVAQDDALSADRFGKQNSADHGLILILTKEQTSELPDSSDLKACLVSYPPTACALLTLELKNRGKETILLWSSTCGDPLIGFDLRRPDGSWEPFPTEPWTCASTFVGVESLRPGKSFVLQLRLTDPVLELDTSASPPHDGVVHASKAYALIAGTGPYTIRARWDIWGCAASDKLNGDNFNLFTAPSLCVNGTASKRDFALVLSNELELKAKP